METRTGLADRLRTGTKQAHRNVGANPLLRALLAGSLPMAGYAALTAQYFAIYRTLERHAIHWIGNPIAGRMLFPELPRAARLRHDLTVLFGEGWRERTGAAIRPATERYCAHLDRTVRHWPGGFLAHHYVRYLGDLSGGQLVRRALSHNYGYTGRMASTFYQFSCARTVKLLRDRYREAIDTAPVPVAEQRAIVAEAELAFRLNQDVFAELGEIYSG
ncbi:heme oxygenase (biliverdin-producing) [Sciscionella sediminilitoris]|uniref:biliverdin-producing heme oxygenase n=1 Tax=Sciscionella sediminilitoris TaxID=1445613 RepID=UPI0004DF837E|nr:biliverdin-producing heme oxygenase [Sciscionella sp. SE31]